MNAIDLFLAGQCYAVAGASTQAHKYGHKVFVALIDSGRNTYPLNPTADEVHGHTAFATIAELPEIPDSLSIVTPPSVTRQVVANAIEAGVKNIWMQPGAEDEEASAAARAAGLNVVDDGSCLLVLLARGK